MLKSAIIRLVYFTRKIFHLSRYFVDAIYSKLFHRKNLLISYNDFTYPLKKNLCIFSHFDPQNIIDDYVIYYLNKLAECDCDIIFVSTCMNLTDSEIKKINTICKKIIIKKNRGLDFSAYKHGLTTEKDLDKYEKLMLTNDSIYGPFFDLNNIISYGEKRNLDMWGATDSYMIKYHIQSYFIVFSKALFLQPLFKKFWHKVYNLGLKNNIIIRYEIGISQYFLKHGFKLGAYCSCPLLENHVNHDPSHHSWDKLILNEQYPFIKRMLIRDNPHQVKIHYWQKLINKISPFDTHLITKHLKRTSSTLGTSHAKS
jgi:lipopolysaccharide biosynthesis protein